MHENDNFKGSPDKVTAGRRPADPAPLLIALRRLAGWIRSRISPRQGLAMGTVALLGLVLGTCSPPVSQLDQIRQSGVLKLVTLNSGTTYYIAAFGPTGFEYDLAQEFAQQLGVKLEIVVAENPAQVVQILRQGRAQVAAGLTVTPSRQRLVHFGPTLMHSTSELVYRLGRLKPRTLQELDAPVHVVAGDSEAERFGALQTAYPKLRLQEDRDLDYEGLLYKVAQGEIAYTVADSRLVAINTRYHPQLRVAFELGEPVPVAWAFAPRGSGALYEEALAFFERLRLDGELQRIADKHFGYTASSGYVGGQMFAKQIEQRLPEYRRAFEEAAAETELDWRLLAAVGYQESHWNPGAVSPTGVRGLMMLTEGTASLMKVNRLDPLQSIQGGARYLRYIYELMPQSIVEPDRTWMALASYNMGYGHLFDARKLTEIRGGNPDRWADVRQSVLLLTQSKWHRQTKYGYARGYEAVGYVSNVRSYYDILVWTTSGEHLPEPEELEQPPVEESPSKALEIETPIL